MVLVKIKPLGWVLVLCALISAGVIGFVVSNSAAKAGVSSAQSASTAAAAPGGYSTSAAFGRVSANDPALAGALPADDLDAGEKNVNKSVTMTGQVVKVFVPTSNNVNILNFAENHKDAISVVIEAKDYGKFPDPQSLAGKQILVRGEMIVFKGQLEVVATSPDQIKIVDGGAAKNRNTP